MRFLYEEPTEKEREPVISFIDANHQFTGIKKFLADAVVKSSNWNVVQL